MSNYKGVHHSHPNHAWDHSTFSGNLPTYSSPKPTLTLTSHLGQNVGLGEGLGGQFNFPETYNDPKLLAF